MSDTMQQPTGTGSLNDPEPAPVKNGNPEVWPLIIQEFKKLEAAAHTVDGIVINAIIVDAIERHEKGVAKYGVGLQPFNGRDALKDAYQESLDMLAYTRQLAWEQFSYGDERNQAHAAELMSIAENSTMAYRAMLYLRDGK